VNSVPEFLKRAADKNGFVRDRYEEAKMPTDFSNLCILPFFGDMRGMSVLSSYILSRYREEAKGSKYFILASWPGFQGLYPYVDEYWSIADETIIRRFYERSEGLRNTADYNAVFIRNFNEFFRDVVDIKEIQKFYRNGLTDLFFEKFKKVRRFMPFVPSASILGRDFNKDLMTKPGYKVFIHPSIYTKSWSNGISENILCKKEFWLELIQALLRKNFVPVIWQNFISYDIASELGDKCIYLKDNDVVKALSVMRATGCVLDVFNSLSRYAILARCPFLAVDERSRYNNIKENEIDDLSPKNIPREYIFSFSTIITDGTPAYWNHDIFQSITERLDSFMSGLNRDQWPTTAESNDFLAYHDLMRKRKVKKMGLRFIKVKPD
jgi:hypothetical protein